MHEDIVFKVGDTVRRRKCCENIFSTPGPEGLEPRYDGPYDADHIVEKVEGDTPGNQRVWVSPRIHHVCVETRWVEDRFGGHSEPTGGNDFISSYWLEKAK